MRKGRPVGPPRRVPGPALLSTAALTLGALALTLLAVAPVRAAGFDLGFFKPSSVQTGYFSEESARVLPEQTLDLGMSFGYARQPLVIRQQLNGAASGDVVKDRFTGTLAASFGVGGRAELGVRVPAVLSQTGDVEVDLSDSGGFLRRPRPTALGDIDLMPRVRLAGAEGSRGFRLTLVAPLGLPTGRRDALAGAGAFSFRPRLIAGWESEKASTSVSLGFEFRRGVEAPSSGLVVGNAVVAGAGTAYVILPYRLWAVGEASVRIGAVQTQTGSGPLTAQAVVGARAALADQLVAQAGVGTGLTRDAGSPRFCALLMLGYLWGRI